MNSRTLRLVPLLCLVVILSGCGEAVSPTAPINIPPLESLVLSPRADTLAVGETQLFTAAAVDTGGIPYVGALVWRSGDTGVFSVSSTGLVMARAEGLAKLYVEGGGLKDSASVLVLPTATGWVIQTSNASEALRGVYFDPDGRLGWVVGSDGVILSTTDAGRTWARKTPTTYNLNGVWFTSALDGWAVGNQGTVLHTLDGGGAWTRSTTVSTDEDLTGVQFTSRDTGWVTGSDGFVARTFDRGATWQKTYVGGQTFNSTMFVGADGWAVGQGGVIAGTHDRGLSWFWLSPSITSLPLKSVWRRSADLAVAVGSQGVVTRTSATADSVAWSLYNAGNSFNLEGVCLPTDLIGFAVGHTSGVGLVLRSDDGGMTWGTQVANSSSPLRAVFFVDERRGWAVGDNGIIRHTSSGGQ